MPVIFSDVPDRRVLSNADYEATVKQAHAINEIWNDKAEVTVCVTGSMENRAQPIIGIRTDLINGLVPTNHLRDKRLILRMTSEVGE